MAKQSISISGRKREGCPACLGKRWTPYTAEALDGTFEEPSPMMLCPECAQEEPEFVTELEGGGFRVRSFTDPNKAYEVHPEAGYCECPAYQYRHIYCKHLIVVEAVEKARSRRFGAELAEETVIELCRKIFAPMRRYEDPMESCKLSLEVSFSAYKTEAMMRAAIRRHGRILMLHEQREHGAEVA